MTLQSKELMPVEGILLAAKEHVFDQFKTKSTPRLVYHNYELTTYLLQLIDDISQEIKASDSAKELAKLAGLFCYTGFLSNYESATETSVRQAEEFLLGQGYSRAKTEKIKDLIWLLDRNMTPVTEEQELFNDALNALHFGNRFGTKRQLLELEQNLMDQKGSSKEQWTALQLQTLLSTKFYTTFGKTHFEPILAQNIYGLKKQVDKLRRKGDIVIETPSKPNIFEELETMVPNRAIQTYFRTNYRNHINLSAIADNKANIMISVNAILLSVLLSLLTYKNIAETNPMVLMAVIIFSITGLASLVYAVLSARPKITTINKNVSDIQEIKKNLVFFGNYVHLDIEEYEAAMDELFRDGALIYGNMTRDIYFLGKVLDKKYRYLTNSYNIFMVGFVATAITLVIALLLP